MEDVENFARNSSKPSENDTIVAINNEIKDGTVKPTLNNNNQVEDAKTKKENKNNNVTKIEETKSLLKHFKRFLIPQFIIFVCFIVINLWIMFCAIMRHVNLNKKFISLKQIKSDEFIKNFISEFIEICSHKNSLYYASIIVSSIAILFHLIGSILLFISLC